MSGEACVCYHLEVYCLLCFAWQHYIPKELYDLRKEQIVKLKEARQKGHTAYFSKAHPDKLFVNGKYITPKHTGRKIVFTVRQMSGQGFCKGHICMLLMIFDAHQRSSLNTPLPPRLKAVKTIFTHL